MVHVDFLASAYLSQNIPHIYALGGGGTHGVDSVIPTDKSDHAGDGQQRDVDSEPWWEGWYSSLHHCVIKYFAYL
jgi:hypothetical protein